jgi:hypothetical protein
MPNLGDSLDSDGTFPWELREIKGEIRSLDGSITNVNEHESARRLAGCQARFCLQPGPWGSIGTTQQKELMPHLSGGRGLA